MKQPYDGGKPYIFISYAHKDSDVVHEIISDMQSMGYRLWFDENIDPGSEWDENIASHIDASGYMIAFISRSYLDSDNCKDELNYARDLKHVKRLLVYLDNSTLPSGMKMRLNRLQAIHKYRYPNQEHFYKVLHNAQGIQDFCDIDHTPKIAPSQTLRSVSKPQTIKEIFQLLRGNETSIIPLWKFLYSKYLSEKHQYPWYLLPIALLISIVFSVSFLIFTPQVITEILHLDMIPLNGYIPVGIIFLLVLSLSAGLKLFWLWFVSPFHTLMRTKLPTILLYLEYIAFVTIIPCLGSCFYMFGWIMLSEFRSLLQLFTTH